MLTTDRQIIYEDAHLLAINKPSGYLSEELPGSDSSLEELLSAELTEREGHPVVVKAAHRLDRPVSGIIVFAKNYPALESMYRLFKYRKVQKTYWAVTRQKPEIEAGRLVHWLTRDQKSNITKPNRQPMDQSVRAELEYKYLGTSGGYHLIEVYPLTGRTHQIRVQLSSIGCPIVDDFKYGYPRPGPTARKSIYLHAKKLSFIHPVTSELIVLYGQPPQDLIWDTFETFDESFKIK